MKKAILILLSIIISNTLYSQVVKVTKDFGAWGGLNIKKELSGDFEINLEQQIRLYTNASRFDDYIIDFGGKYRMNRNFRLGANLRYTYNAMRWKDAENNYRYNLDLNYKSRISKKLELYYRLRYQKEFVNLFRAYEATNIYYSGVRNRIKLKYGINQKNRIYVSGELFRLMEVYREPYFNMIRLYLGDEIQTKAGDFNCSFGYEQEINTSYPLHFFFLKAIYTIEL